ncbi:MAG: SMI1/KNR4 family protein [Oscillospiraceae bacterium]|jgi:hypothetical protein|nr:SMI1/KNR4 family protein [Oscillospiraceae bacterium]
MEDRTLRLIETCVDTDDIDWFWLAPQNSCTRDDVRRVETELGVKLPDEYAAHLTGGLPGVFVIANDEIWPKTRRGGAFWMFMYALHTFTVSAGTEDVEDEMRLINAGRRFMEETGLKAVPILKWQLDADCYCANENGEIYSFSHETGELTKVELDFWALFERELCHLQENKVRMAKLISGK